DTLTICDALRKFGTVSVSKTEMAGGDEIEGATLKIETTADTSNVVLTRDGKNLTEGTDYTVETKNGKTTITFTTGSTKTFVTGLAEGSYTLTETIAPDGYVINESTFDFTVNNKGEVSKSAIEVIDEAVKLSVNKTDLTGKTEVQNAVLTITNASLTESQWAEIASANASVKLTANGDGITWTSGKSAVEIKYLLNGTYTLTETQGDKAITDANGNKYDVLASEVTFVVDNTKNDVVKVTGAKNKFASDATEGYAVFDSDTLTICDALRKFGTVSVSKTEMAGGDEIEGATLKIETTADTSNVVLTRDGKNLTEGSDYTVETKNGKTTITFTTGTTKTFVTGLAEGSYTLTETIAPDGYVINESTFD
ncbi:SpaA isopeptide-forming pilin-related protein, partial [Ruminococcus sp. YE78]